MVAALVACLGCASEPPRARPTMVPVLRFVDELPPQEVEAPLLDVGVHAGPGGETYRTLTSVHCVPGARIASPAELRAKAYTRALLVPPALQRAEWVLVRARLEDLAGPQILQEALREPEGPPSLPVTFRVPALPRRPATVTLITCPLPALAERDLHFDDVVVPEGAMLRTHVATERIARQVDTAPVALRVVATTRDGSEIELLRHRLDPAAVAGDRQWTTIDADLAPIAGQTVRMTFAARALGELHAPPAPPLWGEPTIFVRKAVERPPNVVLISLDTLRARSVGLYGAIRPTTPSLDALAASSTVFDRTVAPFAYTLPSHISMFTGLYQRRHGVRGLWHRLRPEHPTLAETLRAAGYATVAITDGGYLHAPAGVRRGFERYLERFGHTDAPDRRSPHGMAGVTFGLGADWLWTHAGERPFFLFMHSIQVHAPYVDAQRYTKTFSAVDGPAGVPDAARLASYEEEIRAVDDAVRDFVGDLRALGIERETLLIVTSDHGEAFGEHGTRHHGPDLHDEVAWVPLIMHLPGTVPAGRRVAEPVSLVDLRPTILDLLGLPADDDVDGTSLRPLLGAEPASIEPRVLFAEGITKFEGATGGRVDVHAALRDSHKCIRTPDGTTCYDLAGDPDERRPLPDAAVPTLRRSLREFAGAPIEPSDETPGEINPGVAARMRALGYIDDDEPAADAPSHY